MKLWLRRPFPPYLCTMVKIKRNVSLKAYNTFGLDVKADLLLEPVTLDDAKACIDAVTEHGGDPLVMGSGSNLLFINDFHGTIIHPDNNLLSIIDEDESRIRIKAGAGMKMDELIQWCVERNYGGLENLSLIPGMVGAAPVQNIGAYGVEVAETVEAVHVFDLVSGATFWMDNRECQFGYRMSRFKSGNYQGKMIWEVIFSLHKKPDLNLTYQPLKETLEGKEEVTPFDVRSAVIQIRQSKLPDPVNIGNAGSFFKNPVVSEDLASGIIKEFPGVPIYQMDNGQVKIPAGWLIEQCGWKGYRDSAIGIYPKQALVLVNYGGATGEQILSLADRVNESVRQRFGISLDPEVQIIRSGQ